MQIIPLADDTCHCEYIEPDWHAPVGVHAVSTLRKGGVSLGPYQGLNLATHVGDELESVRFNRHCLGQLLHLPSDPFWLNQVHGIDVVDISDLHTTTLVDADASYTHQSGKVCAVLTADCLPVLICARDGSRVAAIHAGWRGLAAGIIENTITAMKTPVTELLAWLGPAIGPDCFEVGAEVKASFLSQDKCAEPAFTASGQGRFYADIYQLARSRLQQLGVENLYGGAGCTFSESDRFYSYRRDGQTGRMATLIWID